MKKTWEIGAKLLLLLVPFFVFIPIVIMQFPMYFFDGEYSWYRENKEYSENHNEYCRVLIMGDSTAKAGWMPKELSEDTYNFSLGGASPVEEYYYLLEYLENNKAPEFLIYTQGVSHFLELDTFWSRSVYFHRMRIKDLSAIKKELSQHKGSPILGEKDIPHEMFLYMTYSPIKYSTAFVNGILMPDRYGENLKKYKDVTEDKGRIQFSTAQRCDEESYYTELASFQADGTIDSYFRKIIELCKKYHIQFIFQNPPLNECSYDRLKDRFVEDYGQYLGSLRSRYPDAYFDTELMCYDSGCFCDSVHLNDRGALQFSREMEDKFRRIFKHN